MRLFCPLGNNIVRLSHVFGWLLIRLLHVFEFIAIQWIFPLCLGHLLWFLLGSCCLLCCLSDGETQIWRLALCFWFVFWLFDLQAACDHRRPCNSFLLTASSHARTEPQTVIGHTRGKQNFLLFVSVFSCVLFLWASPHVSLLR